MKRKRIETVDSDPPYEPVKTKKNKAQVKSSNPNKTVDDIDSEIKAPITPKTQTGIAAAESKPIARKVGRPPKKKPADVNQNGETSDLPPHHAESKTISPKKSKKNGAQHTATLDLPQSTSAEQKNFNEQPLQPEKKKRGRKPQNKNASEQSTPSHGVLKHHHTVDYYKDQLSQLDLSLEEDTPKKAKKKVRIDETESLKIKKELSENETHFSSRELPAKIIKSKSNRSFSEEVKLSPIPSPRTKILEMSTLILQPTTQTIKNELDSNESPDDIFEEKSGGLECATSEGSDLEDYYFNKNAEKEAKKKAGTKSPIMMPKEDQLILVQRMQQVIPDGDTKSYKYRLKNLDWANVVFKNYTLDECQKVWKQLLKKIRHYRLLIEVTQDIKNIIERIDLVETSPRRLKKSKKKHPDMPKRPLTSYLLYFIRKREKICRKCPNMESVDLNKYISEKYQNLPPEKKQKYEAIAAKNKEEYRRQMEEFYAMHPEYRNIVKKGRTPKEKPPKRPDIPYKLFITAEYNREEIADEDKAEFKEVCREKWRQMCDEKKVCWIKLAEEKYSKYQEELKDYMARHPEYTPKVRTPKPFLTREELQLKDKLAGKPKKPASTAYSLFISMTLQSSEIVDIPHKERWNYTSTKWKAMTDEEREQYKLLLAQVQEQYQKDFEAYLESLPEDKRQEEILKNLPKKRKNASTSKASTSGTKPKTPPTKSQPPRSKKSRAKPKVENPVPPPRSAYKYFAEKEKMDNPKEAWKNLSAAEKERYDKELSEIKDKYIKDFEAYLKSLTKEELAAFSAQRSSQEEVYTSTEESESETDHGPEESSEENSDSSDSENETDEH